MMTDSPARRPWWKKKRWAAALAVWLAIPATYTAAYRELVRPIPVLDLRENFEITVIAVYPHPALGPVFAPAEWIDRRLRPESWQPPP